MKDNTLGYFGEKCDNRIFQAQTTLKARVSQGGKKGGGTRWSTCQSPCTHPKLCPPVHDYWCDSFDFIIKCVCAYFMNICACVCVCVLSLPRLSASSSIAGQDVAK